MPAIPPTTVTPGYFDIQVNGYGGVDFNQDALTAERLHTACERLAADGVAGILATLITETVPRLCQRLTNLVTLRERDNLAKQLIAGFHIEGPFMNPTPGYIGAHPADAAQPANLDDARRLLDAGAGLVRLMTLAPEVDAGFTVTRFLAGQGVTVSAGHSNASLDELRGAIDAGLTFYTHLGNGCPMMMHRHDNIIQRVLSLREHLYISFIPDGVHVYFPALRNYLDLVGFERAVIVTDAVAPAGMGPGRYQLGRWDLLIGDDMVARAPDGSHLIGSAITMPRAVRNLVGQLGLTQEQAMWLTQRNPRRAVGIHC
jgi:N-acetylglucosamine-6-phosphate deacetylase